MNRLKRGSTEPVSDWMQEVIEAFEAPYEDYRTVAFSVEPGPCCSFTLKCRITPPDGEPGEGKCERLFSGFHKGQYGGLQRGRIEEERQRLHMFCIDNFEKMKSK